MDTNVYAEISELIANEAKATTEFNTLANETVGVMAASAGSVAAIFFIYAIIGFIVGILSIIATWKLFKKAGQAGWKAIIPIYNTVILFKIAGISPLWILGYLAACIPFVGAIVALGITIYAMISLAKAFGKDGGFAVGLILLNTIFIMILAFGKSEYQLNKTETEVV